MQTLSQTHMENWFLHTTTKEFLDQIPIGSRLQHNFVSCDFSKKTITLSFVAEKWQLNPQSVMHGGLTATTLQFTMDLLCQYFAKEQPTTMLTFDISYQKPIFLQDTFQVVANITHLDFGIIHLTGEVLLGTKLASSASGIYRIQEKGGDL